MTTTSKVTINISSEQAEQLVAAIQSLGIGDVSVQTVSPSPPPEDDLGVISMDDEDDAGQCEISAVIDHKTIHGQTFTSSHWMFKVRFEDGSEEWVKEEDCQCEKYINEYLKRVKIRTIYCFCRVSSKDQCSPGHVSLDAQEEKLVEKAKNIGKYKWASAFRIKVVKTAQSAHTRIPKELKKIGELANPTDRILVHRVDRLSRHVHGFIDWLNNLYSRGVVIYSISEDISYTGKNDTVFLQHLLDATKESVKIGERVKMSIEHRRAKGQFVGGLPYGKKRTMISPGEYKIEDNASECAIINRIVSSWPAVSDRSLAEQLNTEGVTKKGRKWSTSMVGYIRETNGKRPKIPRHVKRGAVPPRNTRMQMVMDIINRYKQSRKYVSRMVIREQLRNKMSNTILSNVLRTGVNKGFIIQQRDSFKVAK
jgi:DNA invertase Pin-like site-specific DNA recombinase